ncbi:MAG: hypothetical protein K2G30_00885 [Muribaculaceae bacterium]|nr:hypothetical protein [Muribaculaceae bacterium]
MTQGPLGAGVGMVAAQLYGNFTLENIKVVGGSVNGFAACGGLVGQFTNEDGGKYTATLNGCSVTDCAITAIGHENPAETNMGIGGANAFIGAAVQWPGLYGTNAEVEVVMNDCATSGCTFDYPDTYAGGGLYAKTSINVNGQQGETTLVPIP